MRGARRARPRETFRGPRLVVRVAPALRARSTVVLVLAGLLMGTVLAAAVSALAYELQSLLHSVGNGP
ncbi:MAG TPA: hypothetical protein VK425_06985 [Acidimicrobiales bacterium]|nr:hypothetical protein [Acidimicrobiales bacterium]